MQVVKSPKPSIQQYITFSKPASNSNIMQLQRLFPLLITLLPTTLGAACNSDNCYNNLLHHTATDFCATYTTTTNTGSVGVPTYVPTSCLASRLSSACTCLYPSATPAPALTCLLKNGDFGIDPWVNQDIINESSYGYNQPVITGPGYASSSAVYVFP